MDELETLIRTEFDAPAPDLGLSGDAVLAELDRRARRRRLRTVTGAIVAVALAGGIIAVQAARPARHVSGAPEPGSTRTFVVELAFADTDRGYAVTMTCPIRVAAAADCRPALRRTTDGGRSWDSTRVPFGESGYGSDFPRLYVLPGALVLSADSDGHRRWVSTDDGATWRPAPDPGSATVDAADLPGDIVVSDSRYYWTGSNDGGPALVLHADGTAAWLAHQPPHASGVAAIQTASDGSLWLVGTADLTRGPYDPNGVPASVDMSRDHGRTWVSVTLPIHTLATSCSLATDDGVTIYVGCPATGQPGAADATPVYRSTDGGAAWAALGMPQPGLPAWSVLALAPDGSLVFVGGDTAWRYLPGGRLDVLRDMPAVGNVARYGGYLVTVSGGKDTVPPRYFVSLDGLNWRELHF